jgi:hypothetical protein
MIDHLKRAGGQFIEHGITPERMVCELPSRGAVARPETAGTPYAEDIFSRCQSSTRFMASGVNSAWG